MKGWQSQGHVKWDYKYHVGLLPIFWSTSNGRLP